MAAGVSLQTSQSGLIGLENQGSAQPASIQARIVLAGISRPFSSKRGSLPPGCSRPLFNHRFWGAVRFPIFSEADSPLARLSSAASKFFDFGIETAP